MLRITVGKEAEDYTTIQEALDAIPYTVKAEIEIHPGIYKEKIFSDKRDLTIRGIGNVVITWGDSSREILDRNMKRGTFRSYTAFFSGEKLLVENITFANTAGSRDTAGQALALYLDVDEASLLSVKLEGQQDTLFLAPLPEKEREANGFYGPQGRTLRLPLYDPELNKKIELFDYDGFRITNFEMESSSLAGLAALMGHRAMTVCCIIAGRVDKNMNTSYKGSMQNLINMVLDRI